MKVSHVASVLTMITLAGLMAGCQPSNQIDIIDDKGKMIEKPKGYDNLPKGMEDIKKKDNPVDKPQPKRQNLDDLREGEEGIIPIEKANEWIANKMKDYQEIDRKFKEEEGITSIYYKKKDGTGVEQEIRIIHPYEKDGVTPIPDKVLDVFLGDRQLNTINDESL
ncbi:hypothetical protein UT300012_23440 [Paraclostridium bifermentans]